MRFVFLSYHYSSDIHAPEEWLDRIDFYVGSLEYLSKTNTVIRVDYINYEGVFMNKGVQYYCRKPSGRKNYFPLKLHRFVKSLKPDILVVASFHDPIQIIQCRLFLGKKVKIIVQNHAEKPATGIKKQVQKIADKCINAYFFASEITGWEWVKKGTISSKRKIHEIMEVSSEFHPIDQKIAKLKTNITGYPVFLWAGRLNENKDPLTVIKAFLKFHLLHPEARLYLIYQTEELLAKLKTLVSQSNCPSIYFIGKIPHKEMQYWLNSADFILSGSHYEGSGTVICEAMSCGVIPVVTNISSFKTITANGELGFLYKPGDVDALVLAMGKAMSANRIELRSKILNHFKEHLSFEAIGQKIQDVAKKL
ncbi:MAG: glycosyltransferase family 4 protein [Ginsengibacter sp.]